jgi:hypothetical protein
MDTGLDAPRAQYVPGGQGNGSSASTARLLDMGRAASKGRGGWMPGA